MDANTPAHKPNLLNEDIALPAAVIYQSRVTHNLHWMQQFANERNVLLAPHGKTTMTPALFQRQLAAGAWGLTIANPQQARVAAKAGAERILMANQLVGRQNLAQIEALLADYPTLDLYCLVDSAAGVRQLGSFFCDREEPVRAPKLLLEIGVPGGRTGCRNYQQVRTVCEMLELFPALELAGVETYEGLIHGEDAELRVRAHLTMVRALCLDLLHDGCFSTETVLLSGAGSAWYDVVAEILNDHNEARVQTVIRPGCYLIHDRGIYQQAQNAVMARLARVCTPSEDLQSSLEVWAYVQSRPEPEMAILTVGKRDAAFDAGLPQPTLHFRPGDDSHPGEAPDNWEVTAIMDQHTMLRVPADCDLAVGDMIALSTSHPCLTFDKWRSVLLVDDQYNVLESMDTYF
ncbi:amino acid deaminase [Microbulbifer aggregans]|uniref:amino acid deaminase n=1 Tax=Microbulbifer aggregans TaxID=1769779 RepID=UPI001CFEC645|nr:amino acid deaminase [Microbulbifer aggregans]